MPRPNLGRERYNITFPPELMKQVDDAAASKGVTRSDLMEDFCRTGLEKRESKSRDKKKQDK